jgi:hypothetical protein
MNDSRLVRIVLLPVLLCSFIRVHAQVKEIKWKLDYQIYMQLANDSSYTLNIKELFHVPENPEEFKSDFVYYPADLDEEYVDNVRDKKVSEEKYKTLWSALHDKLGGGWIHFTNCIAYSLETENLDLRAPLMKRPQTSWKPKPVTDSYKRTAQWEYYIPLNQKLAIKEYKRRAKNGQLGDIKSLPESYIDLFLNTSNKEYEALVQNRKLNEIAKIDLVKVILGANYLGETQIEYMSSEIMDAVKNYSVNKLPSVIIFDKQQAAAVMMLDADGYKINNIVFKDSANLSDEEMQKRKEEIEQIISKINTYNIQSFKKRLGNYYGE